MWSGGEEGLGMGGPGEGALVRVNGRGTGVEIKVVPSLHGRTDTCLARLAIGSRYTTFSNKVHLHRVTLTNTDTSAHTHAPARSRSTAVNVRSAKGVRYNVNSWCRLRIG